MAAGQGVRRRGEPLRSGYYEDYIVGPDIRGLEGRPTKTREANQLELISYMPSMEEQMANQYLSRGNNNMAVYTKGDSYGAGLYTIKKKNQTGSSFMDSLTSSYDKKKKQTDDEADAETPAVTPTATQTPAVTAAVTPNPLGTSSNAVSRSGSQVSTYDPEDFSPSLRTEDYYDMLDYYEGAKPSAFQSKYEDTISHILDTINNKDKFDLSKDTNYQQLYNNYNESYTAAAQRAMRDSMANAQLGTGGYGSTYAQIAGQQAYDNTMQGMNDQNINLMQLAYQMYGDDVANDYNKLSAYQGQDNIDYSRYRDTYNDWLTDRDYYANRYDTNYNNDWNEYQYDTNLDYQLAQDNQSNIENAYAQAYSYVQNGLAVPQIYAQYLDDTSIAELNNMAAQVAAQRTSQGSGSKNKSNNSGDDEPFTAEEYYYALHNKTGSMSDKRYTESLASEWNRMSAAEKKRYQQKYGSTGR